MKFSSAAPKNTSPSLLPKHGVQKYWRKSRFVKMKIRNLTLQQPIPIHTNENFIVAMSVELIHDSGKKCNMTMGSQARKKETITKRVTTKL